MARGRIGCVSFKKPETGKPRVQTLARIPVAANLLSLLLGVYVYAFMGFIPIALGLTLLTVNIVAYALDVRTRSFMGAVILSVYLLPATALVAYIPREFGDVASWPRIARNYIPPVIGPQLPTGVAYEYLTSLEVVQLAFLLFVLGGVAIIVGLNIASIYVPQVSERITSPPLGVWSWCSLLALGTGSFLLLTPNGLVPSFGASLGFSAGWVLGATFLLVALSDALSSPVALRRQKLIIWVVALALGVLPTLLSGQRELLPLVFGMGIITWTYLSKREGYSQSFVPLMATISLAGLVCVVFLAAVVGQVRTNEGLPWSSFLQSVKTVAKDPPLMLGGSVEAIALTPVSVAGAELLHDGVDIPGNYWADLAASSVPGPIAQILAYERPISGTRGPAWNMEIGIGGVHNSAMMFVAGGFATLFIVGFLIGFAVRIIELLARSKNSVILSALLGTLAFISPHWFWYGDKALIAALLALGLVAIYYYLLLIGLTRKRMSGPGEY